MQFFSIQLCIFIIESDSHLQVEHGNDKYVISFEDILCFTTGARTVSPMGFSPAVNIRFHDTSNLPRANTCLNSLSLSVKNKSYNDFKTNFCFGIANAIGFGSV